MCGGAGGSASVNACAAHAVHATQEPPKQLPPAAAHPRPRRAASVGAWVKRMSDGMKVRRARSDAISMSKKPRATTLDHRAYDTSRGAVVRATVCLDTPSPLPCPSINGWYDCII